jgi:hypothetical protein
MQTLNKNFKIGESDIILECYDIYQIGIQANIRQTIGHSFHSAGRAKKETFEAGNDPQPVKRNDVVAYGPASLRRLGKNGHLKRDMK